MSAPSKAGLSLCALFCALAGATLSLPADAQEGATDAAQPDTAAKTTTVTVTAKTKPVRRTTEGTVYDESQNPKGVAGTAADILNTVPSVNVTPDGSVSLRGNGNVQIYVNGRPSVLMRGDSRALTLLSMPGSAIASVEVITNPSARYDANGGGIINIVLKKPKTPGASATLTVNLGNGDRKNIALAGDVVGRRFSLHAQVALREDLRPKTETTDTIWTGGQNGIPDGTQGSSLQTSTVNSYRRSSLAIMGLDYSLSDADLLSVEATAKENHSHNKLNEYHWDSDLAGDLIDAYDRQSVGPHHQTDAALAGTFSHKSSGGDEFSIQASLGQSIGTLDKSYTSLFSYPVTPDTRVRVLTKSVNRLNELKADGGVPLGETAQLSYGFDLQAAQDSFSNFNATEVPGTDQESVNPDLTNRFRVDQTLGAAYVTYQMLVRQLTVLAGLRAEIVRTAVLGGASGTTRHDVANPIPTLHLSYALDATRQIVASASEGFQRPDPRDLNPFMTYVDAQNVVSGNPDLRPQHVASFEAGYAQTQDDASLSLTAYLKASRDTVTDYSYFLSDDVLLTTKRNSGNGTSVGVEYAQTAKLGPSLTGTFSANVFHDRLASDDLTGRVVRVGTSGTAKLGLDYDFGDGGGVSIDSNLVGKAITAQGWRSGTVTTDLTWRRKLTDRVIFILAINDLTNGAKVVTVRQTATLHQVDRTFIGGQQVFAGLRIRFGRYRP